MDYPLYDVSRGIREYRAARIQQSKADWGEAEPPDRWVPANGGEELPTRYGNTRYLYVYNFATSKHGWLNMDTDIVQMEAPTCG